MKLFKKALATFTALLTVFSTLSFGQLVKANVNGTPKELTEAVSNVIIWDTSNGREATQKDGSYSLTKDAKYSFETTFDLSAYDNNLSNGDHFTFNIPAPYTIADGTTMPLNDPETGIDIGDIVLTSAGPGAGASAKVVFKNLDQYLAAKGATEVKNVKGNFFIEFSVNSLQNATPTSFPDVKGGKTFSITVEERKVTDNSGAVGVENFAKYGGVIAEQNWTSATLNKSGNHWHRWRVRINASGKTYNELTLHDNVSELGAPMQYIPENLVVTAGDGVNQGWQLTNPQTLVAGQDYTVTYNPSYTAFELIIHNPGNRRFMVDYSTTAPADGSTVANTVSMTSNGQAIEWADGRSTTEMTVERLSKIQSGAAISIDTAGRITIYKYDQVTRQPLAGAVFKITKPDGTSVTLPPTEGTLGRAQSDAFTEAEMVAGTFKIEEITPPAGYELDPTVREVTLSKKGHIQQIPNKKATTGSVVVNYIREADGQVIKPQAADTTNAPHDTDYNTDADLKENSIVFDGKTYEFVRIAPDMTDAAVTANGTITRVDPATGKVEAGVTKVVTYIYKEKVAPNTPAPNTPAPNTPAPNTPAPNTPAPNTPAPNTPAPNTPAPNTPAPNTPAPNTPAPARPNTNNLGLNQTKVDANVTGSTNANVGANNGAANVNDNRNNGGSTRNNGNTNQTTKILPATGEKTSFMAILGLLAFALVLVVYNKKSKKDA